MLANTAQWRLLVPYDTTKGVLERDVSAAWGSRPKFLSVT